MSVLYALSAIRTPLLDSICMLLSNLTDEIFIICVICAVYWCVDKRFAITVGLSYFVSGIIVQGLKITFRVERPWVIDSDFEPVQQALKTATGYSFPSGHTQGATAFYGSIGLLSHKKSILSLCCAVFILIGFSRMYLGVHTPLDVFTAMFLTAIITFFSVKYFEKHKDIPYSFVIAIAVACIALALYDIILFRNDFVTTKNAYDAIKIAGAGLGLSAGLYIEQKYVKFDPKAAGMSMQIVKYLLGIAGVAAIEFGLKLLFNNGMTNGFIRYFLITLWAIGVYPMIIKRVFSKGSNEKNV